MMRGMDQAVSMAHARECLDLPVIGMPCAACANRIEKVLNRLPSVTATVNFAAEKARVSFQPGNADSAALLSAVRNAGYGARELAADGRAEEKARQQAAY